MNIQALKAILRVHHPYDWFGGMYECSGCDFEPISDERASDEFAEHVVAAIHEAHTIRTIEQLNNLPVMTVIRDNNGYIFEYAPDGEGDIVWWYDGGVEQTSDIDLPALVLWSYETKSAE